MICKQPPWILKSLRLQLSVPFPPELLETAPATSYSWSMAIQVCPPNSKSSLQIWFSLSCPTSSIQYRVHDGIQWQIGSNRSIFWTGTGPGERQDQRHKTHKISYEDWEMTQGEPEDTSVLILLDCNHWFLLVDPEAWGDACWLTNSKQHLTVLQKHIILHILP